MAIRYVPLWLKHAPAPSVRGFATLAGIEAVARGVLISVYPLAMYRALEDAALVSQVYFWVGIASLCSAMMVPYLTRHIPRRFVYSGGALLYVVGTGLAISGGATATIAAILCTTISTATTFVCFNAYLLDYVSKIDLSRAESNRMFYSGLGWTLGPVAGVSLMKWWAPAPFLVAGAASVTMLLVFLVLRMGNGKQITRARAPAPNPLAFLPRFFAQPRLVAGWLFAVIRSSGWWAYIVYVPIFAIENGLGDRVGGITLSISNAALFSTPLLLRYIRARSIRHAVRTGFFVSSLLFFAAAALYGFPWLAILSLVIGSFYLILLDASGSLPFLLAVKPSERTEMSAIFSSYRDVSGIMTPGAAWMVLLVAPVPAIFAAAGAGLAGAWVLSARLPHRLGQKRTPVPAQ